MEEDTSCTCHNEAHSTSHLSVLILHVYDFIERFCKGATEQERNECRVIYFIYNNQKQSENDVNHLPHVVFVKPFLYAKC